MGQPVAAPESSRQTAPKGRTGQDREALALIHRMRDGDHRAFEAIFRRYVSRVYRQAMNLMGNPADAEEVVQEVFLTIYEKGKTFRGQSAFATWLYRLTANVGLTRLRRQKRGREVSLENYLPRFQEDGHHLVQPVVDWSRELDNLLASKDLSRIVREALDRLPAVEKAVLVMSDLQGMPNREIGEALGLSVPAVKARLHHARLFLRGKLAVHLGYSPT